MENSILNVLGITHFHRWNIGVINGYSSLLMRDYHDALVVLAHRCRLRRSSVTVIQHRRAPCPLLEASDEAAKT